MKLKITLVLLLLAISITMFFVSPFSPFSPYSPQEVLALSPAPQSLKRVADFYFDVATGDVRNHSSVNKFGRNADVDSAAAEDIWDGGVWNEPTVGQVYTMTSTSSADTSDGTGARTVRVSGLLSTTGLLVNETITLNGTSWVTLTNNLQMVHRITVLTAGSGGVNAGTIYAVGNTDGTVTAQINAGNNQTLMAVFKIPAESDGCLLGYYASANKATGQTATVNTILKVKANGEVWQIKEIVGLIKDGSSNITRKYFVPSCFEPLTTVKMTMDSNVDDVDGSAGFDIILHPN
ncbi:hypothetical protein LCGC14_0874380 [marine sediment metagenome]|uniref:Uncharacterized protein n=1 Tax=marine sediment metagenome TaxID=412755 RepID=A0A0F9RND4_9ZZZZ